MSLLRRNLLRSKKIFEITDRVMSIINGQPSEKFENPRMCRGIVKALTGVSVFDDTNTERVATHQIIIAYIDGVTDEKWIKCDNKRLKVLNVENCCEKSEVLKLICTERGLDSKVVNNG